MIKKHTLLQNQKLSRFVMNLDVDFVYGNSFEKTRSLKDQLPACNVYDVK